MVPKWSFWSCLGTTRANYFLSRGRKWRGDKTLLQKGIVSKYWIKGREGKGNPGFKQSLFFQLRQRRKKPLWERIRNPTLDGLCSTHFALSSTESRAFCCLGHFSHEGNKKVSRRLKSRFETNLSVKPPEDPNPVFPHIPWDSGGGEQVTF